MWQASLQHQYFCLICGKLPKKLNSSGTFCHYSNYGAISCFACKSFFRRCVLENTKLPYCRFERRCEIQSPRRQLCRLCRYYGLLLKNETWNTFKVHDREGFLFLTLRDFTRLCKTSRDFSRLPYLDFSRFDYDYHDKSW